MNSQNTKSILDREVVWTKLSNKNRTMKTDSIYNLAIMMLSKSCYIPKNPPGSIIQPLTSDTLFYEEIPYSLEEKFDTLVIFKPTQVAYAGMKRDPKGHPHCHRN